MIFLGGGGHYFERWINPRLSSEYMRQQIVFNMEIIGPEN